MRALSKLFFAFALALAAPSIATAQPATVGHEEARVAIAEAMEVDHVPAMAVAVYRGDELVWNEAFGMADLEQSVAARPETLFRLGSVAKVFTATLAARLAERDLVDLDRPIRDYLPEWPERHPPITLRQLLGHLGGVRHYIARDRDFAQPGGVIDLRPYPNRAAILALFAEDDLIVPPGAEFHYTTFGYTLVGAVLEAATGESYEALLQEHVLGPGGIEQVHIDHMFALLPNRARYYDQVGDYGGFLPEEMGPIVNALPLNSAYKVPGGGLAGDAASVARFGTLHYAPGFVGEEMFAQLFTSQRNAAGEETGTGLGWRISEDAEGRRLYHHSGSQQGARANIAVYPDQQLSIAILTNLGNRPRDIAALSAAIAGDFLE